MVAALKSSREGMIWHESCICNDVAYCVLGDISCHQIRLVAASSRPIILSLLLSGESYGYQILQRVRSVSGGIDGMVERDALSGPAPDGKGGLIRSEWRVSEENRMRKYYMLTDLGRQGI